MVITQLNIYRNICFYKYDYNSGPKRPADMILNAFREISRLKKLDTAQSLYTYTYFALGFHHVRNLTQPAKRFRS